MSKADKIKELEELKERGSISEEEFEKLKKEIIEGQQIEEKSGNNGNNDDGLSNREDNGERFGEDWRRAIEVRNDLSLEGYTDEISGVFISPPKFDKPLRDCSYREKHNIKNYLRNKKEDGVPLTKDEQHLDDLFNDYRMSPAGGGGLTLGIISLIAWVIPVIGIPVSIIGLILSGKKLNKVNNGPAVAGLILCILTLIAGIINAVVGAYQGATGQLLQ